MEYIFPVTKNHEAIVQYNIPLFPCEVCSYDLSDFVDRIVPWHWQKGIELFVVTSGCFDISMCDETLHLSCGEGAVLNSGTLHCISSPGEGHNKYFVVVFDPNILAGPYGGVFASEYVKPLLSNRALSHVPLRHSVDWQQDILDRLAYIYTINESQEFGYELLVNAHLLYIWHTIVTQYRHVMQAPHKRESPDEQRIKTMLDYIQLHFREKISPASIAASASISERECFRCFQRVTGQSPTSYLMNYRIRAASEMLLEQERSITDICYACGFGSPSYFSKVFKEKMLFTPLEYRRKVFKKKPPNKTAK